LDEKIVAIIAITILGGLAIVFTENGYLLAAAIAAIAGLAGFKPPNNR